VHSAGRDNSNGIDPFDIGPTRWNRKDALVSRFPEEHPVLAPSVGVPYQFKLLSAERVEGMGDSEPSRIVGTICI
jgi:hypothetical protein